MFTRHRRTLAPWTNSLPSGKPAKLLAASFFLLTLIMTRAHASSPWSGSYVLIQETVVISRIPVVKDVVSATRSVSLQKLVQRGDRLEGQGKLCSLTMHSSSKVVKTTFPEAFVRSLPLVKTRATLGKEGQKTTFHQPPRVLLAGVRLAQPRTEALPTDAKDPRVIDQDGDGFPGMTVRISGLISGEVYLVQRSVSELRGEEKGSGFSGLISFRTEQQVLDASHPLLKSTPRTTPDLSRSFFRLQKVGDAVTCRDAERISQRTPSR